MADFKNIALIGFMASGKSSVGKELARLLEWNFVDTDEVVASSAGMNVQEIFANLGEIYFRKIEDLVIERVVAKEKCVISCGGGSILKEKNRVLLNDNCYTIWLYNSIETTIERNKNNSRPLLNVGNPIERARNLYREREPLYSQASAYSFCTEHNTPREIATALAAHLAQMSCQNS